MASGSAVRAGRAYIELFLDDKKAASGLRAFMARFSKAAAKMRAMGTTLVAAGSTGVTLFGLSLKDFADFEQAMANVSAKVGATTTELRALSEEAKRLGGSTIFTPTEAAKGMEIMAMAGLETAEIMAAIGPVLDTAAAANMDVAQSAGIAIGVMNGMGKSAQELGEVMDVLVKASISANQTVTDLGNAFQYVGPVADLAGISLEEITGSISLLANSMIKGEMAGTAMRGVIIQLANAPPEAKKALSELGIEVSDLNDEFGNFVGIANFLEMMEKGMKNLKIDPGSYKAFQFVSRIFQARQAGTFSTLLAQGSEELRKFTHEMKESAGTAKKVADIQIDTLTGGVTILMSALNRMAIEVGQILAEDFDKWVKNFTAMITSAAMWAKMSSRWIAVRHARQRVENVTGQP